MENTRTWSFPFHSCVVGGPPSIHFFLGRNRKSLKHGFSTFLSAVVLGGYGEFGFSFSNVWLPSSWEGQRKRASQGQGKDRSDVGVPSSQGGEALKGSEIHQSGNCQSAWSGNFWTKFCSENCIIECHWFGMWEAGWQGSLGKNAYMYMYGWVSLLFAWNYHNIVNRLYPSTK